MMDLFGERTVLRSHLSEDSLTRMMGEELAPPQRFLATRHLNRCGCCRARLEQLARTSRMLSEYHEYVVEMLGTSPSDRRDLFIRRLDALLESVPARSWWRQILTRFNVRPLGNATSSFTAATILIFAGLIVFLVGRRQLPTVSAAEFLTRALSSDQSHTKITGSGIIRHRFRVQVGKKAIEHDGYRDSSGTVEPRNANVDAGETDLVVRLALAGVSWDDPLSAASFEAWHDRQADPIDDVHLSGEGLLTIRTRVSSTSVAQESLTVNKDSFHPVERIIEFREFGTVEISEISTDVLSWDKAKKLLFDPGPGIAAAAPRGPLVTLRPSAAQMNETELEARLALNHMSADTGEQIEITRSVTGVQVEGVVEGEERKQELSESLRAIPFLSVSLKSFDDFKSSHGPDMQVTETQPKSNVAQVSPLEQYFVQRGRKRDDLSRISAGLFNCSLAINRSSRSLEQIASRFSASEDLTPAAIQARDELLSRTAQRLLDDLKDQQRLLDETEINFEPTAVDLGNSDTGNVDLARLAALNTAATRELITGAAGSGRTENAMAADLAGTILRLRAAALALISNHSIQ